MDGFRVGHYTNSAQGTGLSVFLFDQPATGGFLLTGNAPATQETLVLEPETTISEIHGLVFTGGSTFGLSSTKGVLRYLVEQNKGVRLPHGCVPIVPAAAIYDLAYKSAISPTEDDAYKACLAANCDYAQSGPIGAGTGATVGQIIPQAKPMTSGLGFAKTDLPGGIYVAAYAVVNAVGDIRDARGNIIAGARLANNQFGNSEQFLLSGNEPCAIATYANTTLILVLTNAAFSKAELKNIAKTASAGMARSISPTFTCYDGDVIFTISVGRLKGALFTIGCVAATVVQHAIWDAVKATTVVL